MSAPADPAALRGAVPGLEPALRLAGTVHRGDLTVAVELAVAPGEVVAILGPNGAGKSTLLRAVAGLEQLRTGRLTVGGDVLDDAEAGTFVPPRDRGVGTVFQDHRLFPHLSALENVAFGPRSHGLPRARAEARAAHWLDRLGVAGLARRRPGTLSGGQAQRVAVARALAADPRALVLDEPLAALDAAARGEVQSALAEHLAAFPGPCLLVTHDLVDALVLADRVVALERGQVVQDAAPSLVARQPATGYLARLVGVNLLQGRRDGEEMHVAVPPAAVRLETRPFSLGDADEPTSTPASRLDGWDGDVTGMTRWGDHVRVDVVARRSGVVDVAPELVVGHPPGSALQLRVPSGATTVVEVPTADITARLRPGCPVRLTVRAPIQVYRA